MRGKKFWLKTSMSEQPLKRERSSSAACAKRDKFTTTRMVSSSCRRRNASTLLFSGRRNSSEPREKARKFFRIAMTRRVHQRSDERFFCWFSTLIASKRYSGSMVIGRSSCCGFALEHPALLPELHGIG